MKKETKVLFKKLQEKMATQYGADLADVQAGKQFEITGPQGEKLLGTIQAQTPFLQKINMPTVDELQGEKVFAGLQKTITGRRKQGRYRQTLDPDGANYLCVETDSGIVIPWLRLDTWARMGSQMMQLYATYVQQQIALDQCMIAWRGISVADNTDTTANPLLEDVNKGFMQWMRDNKPENIMEEGAKSGEISIYGADADYANLDDLGYDLRQGLGDAHRERTDLVFMVGADLVAKEAAIVSKDKGLVPTERAAVKQFDLMGTFGGMPAVILPNFPARGAVITTYSNLSIYTQGASMRRKVKDDDDEKGVIDSYLRREAYVVEDESLFVGIEFDNVVLPGDKPAP
ncbi:phage major capsid protein, P2 family [Serratia marcescens]|uniref:phage major capsid protein, P2 family n=1 Tax=Serratia marcescens TaxID=615 RepID=UPI002177490E|nr:phage major capsid protein, P2 family [Serratia marcescens]CAI1950008.1 phage major capsid protein, P2 family [Serratia marcescens]